MADASAVFSTSVTNVVASPASSSKASQQQHRNRHMTYASPTTANLMAWIQEEELPAEIVPHVLAYAGPHTCLALSKTNRFWAAVMKDEATWRVLCEELYKVRRGVCGTV